MAQAALTVSSVAGEGPAARAGGSPPVVRTTLDHAWDGLRVVEVEAGPREIPEQVLPDNLVVLNLGGPAGCETNVDRRGWKTHHTPHHGVSVYPARLRLAGRSPGRTRYLAVEISPGLLAAAAGPLASEPALEPSIGVPDVFAAHVLLALAEEARSGGPGGSLGAEGLGTALVSHLLRRPLGARPAGGPALPPSRLRRVLEHVTEHLAAPLSLRDLAGVAGMEVFRFLRAFKGATGLPPHRYVLHARVDRSKELLADRSLSISEVALRTGFATPSHFSTVFRRVTSATPRAYRDALR